MPAHLGTIAIRSNGQTGPHKGHYTMPDKTNDPKTPNQAKRHLRVVSNTTGGKQTAKGNTGADPSGNTASKRMPQNKRIGSIKGATNQTTGLTDKQEAFVQAYMSGENASDAYRSAYDADGMKSSTIWTEASLLLGNQKVANRISTINADIDAQQRMGRLKQSEFVLKQLMRMATTGQNEGARVRSLELLGKHAGMFKDVLVVDDVADRSADQIERDISERLKRLGIAK